MMTIEQQARRQKRRAKTQAWRDRTGKQKPISGEFYINGVFKGYISNLTWKADVEGGVA